MTEHGARFLSGGGEMGALIRAFDWASTALGAPSGWPQPLKTTVRLALTTRHPVFIFWGPEGICLYNDAYSRSLGPEKHPGILGMPAMRAWPEIWHIIGPQIDEVMAGNGATWHENALVPILRHGRIEDVYWTYGYGPIDDAQAPHGVGGVLVICTETTQALRVTKDNRLLSEIGELLAHLQDPSQTLDRLVRYCVPAFCDWAAFDLLGDDGSLQRMAVAHKDPRRDAVLRDLPRRLAEGAAARPIMDTVLDSGAARLCEVFPEEVRASATAVLAVDGPEVVDSLIPHSFIAVPLVVRGRTFGVMGFARCQDPMPFDEASLRLTQEIARRAAIAIDSDKLYADLRAEDRKKDEFLSVLAHELRNPLAPIHNALDLLQIESRNREGVGTLTAMLKRQVDHLVRLVDDLMDINRLRLGKITLRREPLDLARVLEDAAEVARPLARELGHRLVVRIDPRPVVIESDPARLTQVIGNLLNNACKFTPEGGRIELSMVREGSEVRVRVTDTGVGVAVEDIERIFEMFHQSGAHDNARAPGLGIGLSLSKSLVEALGGRIAVANRTDGPGTEFTITLPAGDVGADVRSLAADREDGDGPLPDDLSILVVDDNEDAAIAMAMTLESRGLRAAVAFGADEAIASIREARPHLVLLDLGMPGRSGFDLAAEIRSDERLAGLRLAALTGWSQPADRERTRAAGFDAHFVKPVAFAELRRFMVAAFAPDAGLGGARPPAGDG